MTVFGIVLLMGIFNLSCDQESSFSEATSKSPSRGNNSLSNEGDAQAKRPSLDNSSSEEVAQDFSSEEELEIEILETIESAAYSLHFCDRIKNSRDSQERVVSTHCHGFFQTFLLNLHNI